MATTSPRRPLLALARLANRASGRERRVRGFVDALVGGTTVVGWAQDQSDPTRRLEIQMMRGDEILAFGVADLPRKDLTEGAIGDGRYGFRLRVPAALLDGETHDVRLFAVTERGKVMLQRGEVTIAPVAPAEVPVVEPKPTRQQALVGALERLIGRTVYGWAYNPDQPDAPALVDFYEDERFLGSTLADRSRPRLYEKGFPSGARGFAFELPDALPMAAVRLRARVSGTSYDLKRTRDYDQNATQAPTGPAAPMGTPPPTPDPARPAPLPRSSAPRRRPIDATAMPVALWLAPGEGQGITLADWGAQTGDARLVTTATDTTLPPPWQEPNRLIAGADPVAAAARNGAWLLFASPGARLDPTLAATLARLPGFPDVVMLGGEASLPDEAARLDSWLAPDRPGALAVRADVLLSYPGTLTKELAAGRLSPVRRWLAERHDLRWFRLPCPEPGGSTEAPDPDLATRLGPDWHLVDGQAQPARQPDRVSLGLWEGWDRPGLPALRALIMAAGTLPLDLLVPSGGDEAQGQTRLAAAEALLGELALPTARARLVDSGAGEAATVAALVNAIDGEVGFLSDGQACPDAAAFRRMAAWALDPRVGPVGLATGEWTNAARLHGLQIKPLEAGRAGAVSLVSFGLMAVAAQRITGAGAPAPEAAGVEAMAALWSLRLQAHGWQPIAVAGTAEGPAPAAFAAGPLPWPVQAVVRAERLLP